MVFLRRLNEKYLELKVSFREHTNKLFSAFRKKRLDRTDFSIISNNCWAGHVYRYYGLPYKTPTIGLYIWADDYMRFIHNLKGYLQSDLQFITAAESKYSSELYKRGHDAKPIGRLSIGNETVELVFLHYKSAKEAKEKWERRVKRVNYENLIIKNSYQNGFTDSMIMEFEQLPYKKKICFVHKRALADGSAIYYPGFEKNEELKNDTNNFKKYIKLTRLINGNGGISR